MNGPGGDFGRNLDALADCLRGGFGTPDDQPFEFRWAHSAASRRHLRDERPTFFDDVFDVFGESGVTLDLA